MSSTQPMPLQDPGDQPGSRPTDFDSAVEAWREVLQADTKVEQMTQTMNGLLGQVWQRSRQMARIRALAEHLSISGRPKALGEQILGALYGELGCTHGVVWRLSIDGFESSASLRLDQLNLENHTLPAPHPFPHSPMLPFQSQWLDLETVPPDIKALLPDSRSRLYYLPFEHELNLSGFAVLALPKGRVFTESEQEFIGVLQRMSALAMDNAWLYHKLENREERLEAIALDLHGQKEDLAQAHSTLRDVEATRLAFISFAGEALRRQLLSQLSYLRLLADGAGDEEESAAFLKGSNILGSQMLEVLTDLVEWTKLAGGAPSKEPRPLALSPLVEELRLVLGTFPARPGVTVNWPSSEGLPEVMADPERLKQVLLNLLLKGMSEPEASVIPFWIEREPMSLNLSLRLHLVGLDPVLGQAALAPRDSSADPPMEHSQVGAGLGLVMGQRLMRAMDGNLRVDPSVDGGSIVSLEVPLA